MGIDDEVDPLPGSNHVALRVDLRLGSSDLVGPPSTSPGLYLNPKRDVMCAKVRVDELLDKLDWDNLSCSEASVFRQATLNELERIQNMVGRFILQVLLSTSRALAWMDADLVLCVIGFCLDRQSSSGM